MICILVIVISVQFSQCAFSEEIESFSFLQTEGFVNSHHMLIKRREREHNN